MLKGAIMVNKRKPRRDKIELWLDRHNHKLELIRTIGNIVGGIAGAIAILRVLGII
jgi:hypothetical protein